MRLLNKAAIALTALVTAVPILSACGNGNDENVLRLGYFANVTHAPALVAIELGLIEETLGDDVTVEPVLFNAGPTVIEALFSGAIDAAYVGPNPAINGWAQSGGEALHVISGSTSGGAALVTRDGIDAPADLAGTAIASPQLANTQDVALRYWLAEQGFDTDYYGGGDVAVTPTPNSELAAAYATGAVDGAWAVEPHLSELIIEHDANVLLDERELWEEGEFVTTHIIAASDFLAQRPEQVEALLQAHLQALDLIEDEPDQARAAANDHIESLTGNRLGEDIIAAAFDNLTFTADPIAASLYGSAEHATAVGLLDEVDLGGIYRLEHLNAVLSDHGREPISGDRV
ncbi:ABC transporter substrate-binding protein [Natronoglycomyces albus]|uniref:ABC transporter substrate-binding protein n=1 Tax=Natronoglycomyces albus TaxID=2811108 RepID=A0A895XLL0_9ACTN|nr:ABC transporter substrate-binding protein [Natronoglycomyces albus]QSB05967.1 ABC transporter substrate-binding protein [Natronoglycomyces albus]